MTIKALRDQSLPMRHILHVRNHIISTDGSVEEGGNDAGPSPHDLYDAALSACKALTAKHGGKLVAKSAPQPLEGAPQLPAVMVVIEFPSAAQAQAWYNDPEHARLKELRQGGADFSMVLVGA